MPTPAATAILQALAGARSGARDLTAVDLEDIRVGLARGAAGPGVVGALAGTMTGPTYGGGGCSGGASPFSGYAPAGLLTITHPAPGANTASGTLAVTGAMLPAGSILVLDLNQNGDFIAAVASDDQPQGIGAGGVGFSILNLNNQNAPGLYLAIPATRDVKVTAVFTAASLLNDRIRIQVLSPGGRSVQAQACGI
jgi:hypothetical protein